jgi:ferredoxin--NADP+ reductase
MSDVTTSSAAHEDTQQCNASICAWKDLTPEIAIIRVKPDEGVVPDFEAGQFATLALPRDSKPLDPTDNFPPGDPRWKKLIRRAYSIASSPLEKRWLEFYIVMVNGGKLTPRIWAAKDSGRIWLDPRIKGEFTMHPVPAGKDIVTVSTGTGLAPFISMLKTYRGTGRWKKFVIIHGVRASEDLGYREELEQIAAEDKSFVYIPTVTREPEGSKWTGERGRVTTLLEDNKLTHYVGRPLDSASAHVFLCGNPDMINQVESTLHQRGFVTHTRKTPGNLHFERYW